MSDYFNVDWLKNEKGEDLELNADEYGWAGNGTIYADLRECIAISAYDHDSGFGCMDHMLAENMNPSDVTERINGMWHDALSVGDPKDFNWYAIGGYPGEADYTAPFSRSVEESDTAQVRRIRADMFFEQKDVEYYSEWLDDDEIMRGELDLDKGEFRVTKLGENGFDQQVFQDNHV